ncbi:MAG TPA: glutathione S-transferase N-terminal domain-containing protein [Burkholderiaceae bacterium]|nr:glutathione S-transferase N-terminal domain-containing protein [Burkholderiaceae bacterium]
MLTLYGARGSGAAAIEAALAIAGVQYRSVQGATWEPGPGFEELKRVNPLGQVPTLMLDDGSVLTESAAILIHLGLQYAASGLLPTKPGQRAQVIRGLVYIAANCYAAIGIIDYPERWYRDEDEATTERVRAGTRARLHALWEIFADTFPATPWLSGEQLGALDLLAAVVSRWSGARNHLAQARPALHAHLERVEADPRIAAVFARHWPPNE